MLIEERTSNGGYMGCSALVPFANDACLNGHTLGFGEVITDGSSGEHSEYSAEGFRTYKRRRKQLRLTAGTNLHENGRVSVGSANQLAEQSVMQSKDIILLRDSYEQDGCSRVDVPVLLDGADDCPNGHWRSIVLELILRSLRVNEGGIQSCIQEAVMSSSCTVSKMNSAYPKISWTQEPGNCHENSHKTNSQLLKDSKVPGRSHSVVKEQEDAASNKSQNEANSQADVHHVTDLCQRVLHNVIVSEKFDLLCKLLCENFHGIKFDSFLDFSVMNSRMNNGAYEQSPGLFSSDLQQVWHEIRKIGSKMVFLAKGLSDFSRNSCAAVGGSIHGTCEEGESEEINRVGPKPNVEKRYSDHKSGHETEREKTEACGLDKKHTCRHCGIKADGKDCLVCDSCEEIYHVSCLDPVLEEIPSRSWYCPNCAASGIESLLENCVVYERINDARTRIDGCGETLPMEEYMLSDLEERSDCSMEAEGGLQLSSGNKILRYCKLCGSWEEDGRRLRICGHPLCPNKYYHLRCLTTEQLKSYGPHWYCPSCICRTCLTDQDDDKIVLCDGCDHAYHIYCMEPPRSSIPSLKWFCSQCDAGIQAEGGLQLSSGNKRLCYCKLCGVFEEDGRRLRICGHPLCPNKYYHLRCLTTEQLKTYGPHWYCPSCLCRTCLTDQDDDKIVLCDGCDHAYHIYCMEPPRSSIPRGKWFCSQCDAGIQAIRRAKRAYENLEKQRKHSGGLNDTVGSVDMLLNAAEKLKCEEKLAATRK